MVIKAMTDNGHIYLSTLFLIVHRLSDFVDMSDD